MVGRVVKCAYDVVREFMARRSNWTEQSTLYMVCAFIDKREIVNEFEEFVELIERMDKVKQYDGDC
jgi:hypothetical protein